MMCSCPWDVFSRSWRTYHQGFRSFSRFSWFLWHFLAVTLCQPFSFPSVLPSLFMRWIQWIIRGSARVDKTLIKCWLNVDRFWFNYHATIMLLFWSYFVTIQQLSWNNEGLLRGKKGRRLKLQNRFSEYSHGRAPPNCRDQHHLSH